MTEAPTLPVFRAKRSKDFPSFLIVTCPREECGEIFIVRSSTWRRRRTHVAKFGTSNPVVISGRVCPYCSKAGRLPAR